MAVIVRLAGYNIDADLLRDTLEMLRKLEQDSSSMLASGQRGDLKEWLEEIAATLHGPLAPDGFTPETLSAAYARISRDPKPVTDLRRTARGSVARSRKSNESIIFGLGHASVAEHACFNFDVLGLSRLAAEELQSHRLVSFTEKSQRYITLSTDYVVPQELKGTAWEATFHKLLPGLFGRYDTICRELEAGYAASAGDAAALSAKDAEIAAKEDARYLLPLACTTQMGVTMNARSVEHVCRDFSDHPLEELRALGLGLHDAVGGLAPSLVKYTSRGSYPRTNRAEIAGTVRGVESPGNPTATGPEATLLNYTERGEERVLDALHFTLGQRAGTVHAAQAKEFWRTVLKDMTPHDAAPREFELASMTFEAVISASCFAQLKRHRMMTLLAQPYSHADGVIVPPSLVEAGLQETFLQTIEPVLAAARQLQNDRPLLAPYLFTNAQRRRVRIHVNARELYHFARLRCDCHAQWEIRSLAEQLLAQGKAIWPDLLGLACGKDQFADVYRDFMAS